jgi:hypothetical protein
VSERTGFLTCCTSVVGHMAYRNPFSLTLACMVSLWVMHVSSLKADADPLTPQGTEKPTGSIDAQVLQDSGLALNNVFIDVTDLPTDSLAPDSQEGPEGDPVLVAAHKFNLSTSRRESKTVLYWPKPDVMALANRILAGEDIQRAKQPSLPEANSSLSGLTTAIDGGTKADLGNKDQLQTLRGEQWLSPFEILGRGILLGNRQTVGENNRIVGQIPLFRASRDVQILTLARTQEYLTRSLHEGVRDLWISDVAWAGVTLKIVKIPNAVVRKADVGKPRPELALLTVRKETYLGTGASKNVSQLGLAVLGETE